MLSEIISAVRPSVGRIVCGDIDSIGTAFVVHETGFLVSANHVVSKLKFESGALTSIYSQDIHVELSGRSYRAEIVNDQTEPAPLVFDYVILKIEANGPLPAIELERFSNVSQGDDIVCAGFPLNFDELVISKGIVSALVRHPSPYNTLQMVDSIVTDSDMQFGSSGGPLLCASTGKVAGINTRKHNHFDDLQTLYYEARETLPETDVLRRLVESTHKFRHLGFNHANAIHYTIRDAAYPAKES